MRAPRVRPGVFALVAIALIACGRDRDEPTQPIPFDHSLHAGKLAVPCLDCHVGAERSAHASLPALSRCLVCHMKPQGEQPNPREHLIRELAIKGGPFKWIQVTRNPNHVHFSHSAHVTVARMPCRDCHGDVTTWTKPPTSANPALTNMNACMACHRENGATTECSACHQ